ncbi:MAG TPA: hypothetical protein VJ870_08865 [Amycolatopsis sp.]|nr:hypothetical protein [Amycolatopsis sp.]
MAELGQTTNPRDLVPGSPESISADLRSLVGTIRTIGGVGGQLGGVNPAQWEGQGSAAFREVFGDHVPQWGNAVSTLGQGAQRLADYGDTLTWAQSEAQSAIEEYTQAQAASRAAQAQQAQAAASGADTAAPAADDPGAEGAQAAQSRLAKARSKLEQAGTKVAGALALDPDGKGGFKLKEGEKEYGSDSRQKRKVRDPVTGEMVEEDPGGWQSNKGGRSYSKEFGNPADGLLGDKVDGYLKALGIDVPEKTWEASAGVDVLGGSAEGKFDSGLVSGEGKAEGSLLGADASATASASALGVSAGASAEAYLAKGSAEGQLNLGDHANIHGSGEAIVGAKAEAQGSVGWTGAEGSAEAFAGAKASGDVGAEVAGVGAGAHGEAWAGAGAEASGQVGMGDDGKFHVGGSVGVALGVGGKVGFDVSVDPGEVADTVTDVGKDVGNAASDAGHAIAGGAKKVWNSVF